MPRKKRSEDEKRILNKMVEIAKSDLLPSGYARLVLARLQEKNIADDNWTPERIYAVTRGRTYDADIVDEVLTLAKENKLKRQIAEADDLLND